MSLESKYFTEKQPLAERHLLSLMDWIERIEGPNQEIVMRVMQDPEISELIMTAPGSRAAHQAFPGGYQEHVRQTMFIASHLYDLVILTGLMEQLPQHEQFTESDALLVLFLHDIEKPFLFRCDSDGSVSIRTPMTKPERTQFRTDFIERFGFILDERHQNALDFVEGVRDHLYVPGNRADKPLAAICHAADNTSARAFYNYQNS